MSDGDRPQNKTVFVYPALAIYEQIVKWIEDTERIGKTSLQQIDRGDIGSLNLMIREVLRNAQLKEVEFIHSDRRLEWILDVRR